MFSRTLTLNARLEPAFSQLLQTLGTHQAAITAHNEPWFLAFTLGPQATWTNHLRLRLEGSVRLEPLPDARTLARIELQPSDDAVISRSGFQGVATTMFGLIFIGPMAQLIVPDSPEPTHSLSPPDSVIAQLRYLAELHALGVLSSDEFKAKKSSLLSQI